MSLAWLNFKRILLWKTICIWETFLKREVQMEAGEVEPGEAGAFGVATQAGLKRPLAWTRWGGPLMRGWHKVIIILNFDPKKPDFSFTTHGQKVSFYLENSYLFVFKFLPRGPRASRIYFEEEIAVGFYVHWKKFFFRVRLMWFFTIMEWIKPHITSLGDILEKFLHFFIFNWPENMLSGKAFW